MLMLLRVVLFVIMAIIVSALAPFLAIQQPLVFVVLVGVFLYLFSRRFARRTP